MKKFNPLLDLMAYCFFLTFSNELKYGNAVNIKS